MKTQESINPPSSIDISEEQVKLPPQIVGQPVIVQESTTLLPLALASTSAELKPHPTNVIPLTNVPQGQKDLPQSAAASHTVNRPARIVPTTSAIIGMTDDHSLLVSKFAIANDVLVIWRPINSHAAEKLGRTSERYMGKALNTKAKSSEFGPIAGDIPLVAGLSKLAIDDPEHVNASQARNDVALREAEAQYQTIRGNLQSDKLQEANELLLLTAVLKKDELGREIYYDEQYDAFEFSN